MFPCFLYPFDKYVWIVLCVRDGDVDLSGRYMAMQVCSSGGGSEPKAESCRDSGWGWSPAGGWRRKWMLPSINLN